MTDLTDVGYRLSKRDINRAITALMNQRAEIVCEKYEEWMANGQSEKWEMLNERSHNLQTSIENFQSAVSDSSPTPVAAVSPTATAEEYSPDDLRVALMAAARRGVATEDIKGLFVSFGATSVRDLAPELVSEATDKANAL